MTTKEKCRLAIKMIRKYAQEHFGREAKFNPEKRKEWDKCVEIIAWLQKMNDEGSD